MKNYLALVPKYLSVHKKKTRLVILSVAISVALVTGIFSMLDFFLRFEKVQQLHEYGNFHILVKNVSDYEKQAIAGRIDVQNSGTWISFKGGNLCGKKCQLAALDENFASNMQITVLSGKYPVAKNEMLLEAWAAESFNLKVGDTAKIVFPHKTEKTFTISGIYSDYGSTKAAGVPGVYLSTAAADTLNAEESAAYFLIEFKNGVNINAAQKSIQSSLNITDDRIGRNEYLLAVMGYGESNAVRGLYATGAVLFCIVLIAGIMMIYNTFNISMMERVQQFGLLRCIGASKYQIKKLVKREGLCITLKAIPIGLAAGMALAFICSAILKFYNSSLFKDLALFNISLAGITAGILVGFLTVSIAASLPANKAAGVSPVSAVTGSSDTKISKKKKRGFLTKIFNVETALGIGNAVAKKKTLILMSCSIAISIVMFLGFQVFVDFMHTSLKTTKPYTPDIVLTSEQGLSNDLYRQLADLRGIKNASVSGRMFDYVNATFAADRLTDTYKKIVGDIPKTDDGLFIPPEKSWLISYDKNQLRWAKVDLIAGKLSREQLNQNNGIIAVAEPLRNGIGMETAALKLGDKIYIQTPGGTKEMNVMAILRKVPFNDSRTSLTTFITTEQLFTELTGKSTLDIIQLQLKNFGQKQTVAEIKGLLDSSVSFYDQRQKNAEINGYFLTMAVFIYGFVTVIALISILNIINTMNTSVAAKTRYLGVMRAVGMSGAQLDKMVLTEAFTYSLTGCTAGCIWGILLQKALIAGFLSRYHIIWRFPFMQVVMIIILVMAATALSVIGPLKRIKTREISEIIGAL